VRAQPDAQQGLEELGLLEGGALGLALDEDLGALAESISRSMVTLTRLGPGRAAISCRLAAGFSRYSPAV
jgi:hypothetical protein